MRNLPDLKALFLFTTALCLVLLVFLVLFDPTSYSSLSSNRYSTDSNSTSFGSRIANTSNAKPDGLTQTKPMENITLIVVISTAPERRPRRDRIRQTYWKHCYNNSEVRCFFVTDGKVNKNVSRSLQEENSLNNDMVLQPLSGGREFGLRFLHQIRWATAQFNFKYFLRADDDYFICLSKLIHELEYRPKQNLLWANFHCEGEGLVWPDEAWMVFTKDLIDRFLSQNKTKMYCHPHADQQIALWMNDIPSNSKAYFHDKRLHHTPPAAKISKFNGMKNICDTFMGLHGAYGDKMLEYHRASNDGKKKTVPKISRFDTYCPHKALDWTRMGNAYRFEPKLCNENPDWSLGHDSWKGAEADQGRR